MSRRVTLYIGGHRCDLPDESPIQFTWTREDLDNPTVVRNSYTHQLTLPGTPANDAVFGHFGRAERTVTDVPGQTAGPAYNPLKKAPFALYSEDATVLARGYAKLDNVLSKGGQAVSYKVSLYGGLGSLFYDLTYGPDGQERTLADLIYDDGNGNDIDPATEPMSVDRLTVAKLWGASVLVTVPWERIMTFAPCYNGLPEGEFDANKALVTQTAFYNFPGQTGYGPLGGGSAVLATFQGKHTEWETRDFRSWLQRPAVSVKAVLEALTDRRNTGDWVLALDGAFFGTGTNPWYDDAWMTLPLLQRPEDGDWTAMRLADALRGSMTPAAFLIGYAKQFGLVFDVDESAQVVTLMARDDYYGSAQVHDLSERIDIDTVELRPCNAGARWYEMKAAADGSYVKEYEKAYGRVYGSQRIDTGWEFDSDVKDLLPRFPFRGAADVLETSPDFYLNYYSSYGARYGIAMADTETVKYRLYDGSGNAQDFDAFVGQYLSKTVVWYNAGAHGFDAFPKVQLHGEDGKGVDGSGVLLIRTGEEPLPGGGYMDWHVSDDNADMAALNEGRPCWIMAGSGTTSITKLPTFRRMAGAQTMDFGAPRETAVPGETTGEGASVYYNRWKGYLSDRLDRDTKVLTCRVDWRGRSVGAALLRHFYWYRNCLWSLNRIRNYAPTADALTECEFVQVRDRSAYASSQAVPAMESWYLNASPDSLAFSPSGQTLTLTITANVAWTLTVPVWVTANAASGSGNATVTLTAAANGGAARTGTVTLSGAHGTSASVALTQDVAFTPSLSVWPNNRTYDDKARTFYYTVTCNGRWQVRTVSAAWITCTDSGTGNGSATISIAANNGSSSRSGYIVWEMPDYPATTFTTYITQSAQADTVTYALELSKSSHTFPATGGSQTLTAQGVTYTNGVETARVALSATALSFSKSGSDAISRSGLMFSAADLGTTPTSAQTTVFTVTWSANGAQATFTATQAANEVTYELALSETTHVFSAAGGSYTLGVEGVTKRAGVEVSRTALSASALAFTVVGSAVSRSGLVFSAADLLTTETPQTDTIYTLRWNAHSSATATFTGRQQANIYTISGKTSTWSDHLPNPVRWSSSGVSTASYGGDTLPVSAYVDEDVTATATYASGHSRTVSWTTRLTGELSVSGAAFSLNNGMVVCGVNQQHAQRTGTLTLRYNRGTADVPDWYIATLALTQQANPSLPTGLSVLIGHDYWSYDTPTLRPASPGVLRWTYAEPGAPYQYVYTTDAPERGDGVFSNATLATLVGAIDSVIY